MVCSSINLWTVLLLLSQSGNPFHADIRPTEPLTPAQQQAAFQLPDGFDITLFASEPDIQKPMNMAFDDRGRLWITGSVEYPFAAEKGKGRDTIKVLEDTNGDGQADRMTTFADDLNIPIGLYPYGRGVVTYSIPNIWYLEDTSGDGRADHRQVLYGPLGEPDDTHGMQNAFRRGFDGWLYINHGFANESTVRGGDGSEVRLHSGNTYRVRLDGSRVEQYTWGQVNPFGATWTPAGDLINADCHSKPLSLLLRGGHYPSFGKPHDGLGFVPPIMDHLHGSTAIAGAAICTSPDWPEEYHDTLFVGNVMTCRVHRNRMVLHGSTMVAEELDDFIRCDDPWFRPVDLQFGPDGALYIADFYNRIIGHYEVPLDHPGRDHFRARIWRVTYTGSERQAGDPNRHHQRSNGHSSGKKQAPTNGTNTFDLTKASIPQLIDALGDANLTTRMLATDVLSDRVGEDATEALRAAAADAENPWVRVHAAWVLHRTGHLEETLIAQLAGDSRSLVRTHAMRMLAEHSPWAGQQRRLAESGLQDSAPLTRRAAADALACHPAARSVPALLAALRTAPDEDVHLRHMIRIALRNHFRDPDLLRQARASFGPPDLPAVADVLLAVEHSEASDFLLTYLQQHDADAQHSQQLLAHAVKQLPPDRVEELIEVAKRLAADDVTLQLQLLESLQQSIVRRDGGAPQSLEPWARSVAEGLLASLPDIRPWQSLGDENPWDFEPRRCADGEQTTFLSSLPGGEQQTGVLRSPPFVLPESFSFWLCGHRGFPDQPASDANRVRLRLVESGEVIAEAFPPRSDTAQRITWDVYEHAGEKAVFELVDGLALDAYAWLAVARFEPDELALPATSPRQAAQRQQALAALAETFRLIELALPLQDVVAQRYVDWSARSAAARALLRLEPDAVLEALVPLIDDFAVPQSLREQIAQAVVSRDPQLPNELVTQAMQSVARGRQQQLAQRLAGSPQGGKALLATIEQGHASAHLLQQPEIRQRLTALDLPMVPERLAALTTQLQPVDEQLTQMLRRRIEQYSTHDNSVQYGQQVFTDNCANCHQVGGQGALIGPQLDGIGNRGLHRVAEDVLDPNRNVDAAFRTSVLALKDGRVVVGLPRREEGGTLIVATQEGEEIAIAKDAILQERPSTTSLMPGNFDTVLTDQEFNDLLAFLLSLRED